MTEGTQALQRRSEARFSIPSILAITAALVSFFVQAGWGLALAILAMLLGFVGFIFALAPGIRGGVISILSLIGGGLGIVVALLKIIIPG